MADLEILRPDCAPPAVGPYCPMIRVGNMIWGSALAGVDAASGEFVERTVTGQTRKALRLISEMLEASDSDLNHVVSVTVFLRDINWFAEMNRAYVETFGNHQPTRSVVEVTNLPKQGALLTMNFVAVTKN